jgi:hypothetical protein
MQNTPLEAEKNDCIRLVNDILELEWEMFQAVRSASPASCQNNPTTFRKVRGGIYQLWPSRLLASYLIELTIAKHSGRNLLTEKYARMDNLIPPLCTNPVIDKIVDIETKWQQEVREQYPALYARSCRSTDLTGDGKNFSVYLRCELETYGDTTLDLYYEWVELASRTGINYSLSMLNNIVLQSGFKNLNDAESYWKDRI